MPCQGAEPVSSAATNPYRIPVIIGAGQISDRGQPDKPGPSVLDLMATALRRADADAGGNWLANADFLCIENQISSEVAAWPGSDPITPHVIKRLGIAPRSTLLTEQPSGDGPVWLLNIAANRIASGEVDIAALVGAEALRTAAQRAATEATAAGQGRMHDLLEGTVRPILQTYGLLTPTDAYPLYESATRAAWGLSFDQAQQESARIWSGFSEVAARNPHAWIRTPCSAQEILTVDPANRMVTFPYTKRMVANSAVNQGAALIVTSLGRARDMGVPTNRIVYIGAGASAREHADILERDSYTRSPAMAACMAAVLQRNAASVDTIDHVELYSCFPCVGKMAQRELGWPLDRPASVYGGLTFGGGPIGNCMMHAAAAMMNLLRGEDRLGLIFANGGFATSNHAIILSGTPCADHVLGHDPDAQPLADRLRGEVPKLVEGYEGPGMIEAVSIPFGRDGAPKFATIVARTPGGQRFLARVLREDDATLAQLMSSKFEPVGRHGQGRRMADGLVHWQMEQAR